MGNDRLLQLQNSQWWVKGPFTENASLSWRVQQNWFRKKNK